MEAKIVNLQTLFEQQVSYLIPQFQRPYAWKEEIQWKPLWDDIRSVAEHFLNKEKIRPHFMGAIVLQLQQSNTGEVTKRLVIDGQQRLTTLQLLIRATEQVFQSQDDTVRATRLSKLTTNQDSHWGGDGKNETKIRQSNYYDQVAFHAAIRDSDSNHQSQDWAINEAYEYFKGAVDDWLKMEMENRIARADALEETLTKYLQIVVIDLDQDEKPHIIFETLNARGEPLKQSDLIKNTVMYEARVIDDAQKAKELWGMFGDRWWREEADEKLKRPHIDRFLNHWMVIRTQREVAVDEVARRFRDYIERKNRVDEREPIEVVAEDIRKTGEIYKDLETIKIPEIETFLKRMKVMKLGVVTPLLLWLYTSGVSEEQRLRSVKALESCLVRRMLCGIGSHGLLKIFIAILHSLKNPSTLKVLGKVSMFKELLKLDDDGVLHPSDIIVKYLRLLSQWPNNRMPWPNDRMLYDHLTTTPMRGAVARKRMVLEAVETYLRGDKAEPLGDTDKLTVEHIMPEKWQQNWPLPPDKDETEATNDRDEVVKLVGNFTLTTAKLNAKLSNNPWNEKRKTLDDHSSLFLNKTLLEGAPDVWDEAAIEKRSGDLAKIIMQIWPSADNFNGTPA